MMAAWLIACMVAIAVGQVGWVAAYVTSPWRATPIGWVWLFKGSVLAAGFTAMAADLLWGIPDGVWAVILPVLAVAVWVWFIVTLRAKRSDFLSED